MNAPVSDLKVKMWSPAVPLKTPDNIVSSQFTLQKVFVPSYEKEKRPCMEQLLTNEYQRIWWQEKETWDRRFNATPTTKKLLQRKVIRKKSSKEPVKEIPKKIIKSRRKVEPKKTAEKTKTAEETKKPEKVKKSEGTQKSEEGAQKSEGTKKSKATEVIPTETTDDKQEDK
ncbi:uncharacterized protein LOC143218374 isoform X2 [Lasioglossum baleicum]|uniref:uncharacterized protein LOC143218374 isoform X2 n=1 Tax=Lasioglossum baleicum TaxID=434251 RepID=UPI003FCC5153